MQSSAGHTDNGGDAGFTLLEVVCVLAIVAMLAAIVLPAIPRGTSMPELDGYALQAAAILNADHAAAQRQHRHIATMVDAPSRMIQSGASGRLLRFPSDVTVQALLASRCENRAAGGAIHYLASGLSCGGVLTLTRAGTGFQVRVNWLTGMANVAAVR